MAAGRRLVAEGARVCLTARRPDALAQAVDSLGGGEVAIGIPGHGDDAQHQAEAVRATVAAFGRLDVLINNTGINPAFGPLTELDDAVARKIIDVNVLAALRWVRQALAAGLGEDGMGAVVNIASIAGVYPSPGIGYYGVSKSALIGLTRQLAAELSPGVRVNAVAPAVVRTRFASALYEGHEDEAASAYPLGRLGEPEDVAAAVAFLASSDASWVTGQTLLLDGGLTLRSAL